MKVFLVTILTAFAVCGCAVLTGGPDIEVAIENQSSRDLENAHARFGDFKCSWGNVGRTFKAIHGSFPHPITAETELHWDQDGGHRAEKIDLRQIYHREQAGRLTFTVMDRRVDVVFREH